MSLYKVVLLIDDDREDQEIFGDAVREVDRNVRFMSEFNSDQAITNITTRTGERPEIIFLDLNMPRLNGKQVLSELKRDPEMSRIPVVMCSTFFGDRDKQETARLGAAHHLVKPTRFNELCEEIAKILTTRW
jgi:CheY-like chemotaxis protein